MSFIRNVFVRAKDAESVVLIDIGAQTVSGAYALFVEGQSPVILYERSMAVEFHEGEAQEQAVLRALKTLGETILREGAPVLIRAVGKGNTRGILVSIDAPWQRTSVRTEYIEEKKPFLFTKHLVSALLEKTKVKPPGKMLVDESVIGTVLNGYETNNPYGKEAHRAEIMILTSLIDEVIAKNIVTTLRSVYHTRHVLPIAGTSLRYQAVRNIFPHERDALILDVTGPLTSIALIRNDLFVSIIQITDRLATIEEWVARVVAELVEVARRYPLPRTIFLLAREPEVLELQKALAAASLGDLWLSDSPPAIVPVLSSQLTSLVRQATTGTPDLLTLLMALYWRYRDPVRER
ncbi:hypothetical protein KGM48_01160 [Patescibacteria group bacterium]|nr:hypothetical protein [Patescibacteria group bacterium]